MKSTGSLRKYRTVLPLLIIATGFILRINGLGDFWINPDEGIFYNIATTPAIEKMHVSMHYQSNPPLYYYLIRLMSVFSHNIIWLRMLSVLSGTAAILIFFMLAEELGNIITGTTAALLLALSPGAIVMSQIMRPYMTMMVPLLLCLLFLARYHKRRLQKDLWLYSAALAVTVFIHYAAYVALAGIIFMLGVMIVTRQYGKNEVNSILLAHLPVTAVTIFLYLWHIRPNLIGSPLKEFAINGYLKPFMMDRPGEIWISFAGTMTYIFGERFIWAAVILLITGIIGSLYDRKYIVSVLPLSAVAAAALFSFAKLYPFGGSRHSIYLITFLGIPIAYSAKYFFSRTWKFFLPVMISIILIIFKSEKINSGWGKINAISPKVAERVIPLEDFQSLLPFMEQLKETKGIVLMDLQTFEILGRVLRDERYAIRLLGSLGTGKFQWGKRTVLVNFVWKMEGGPEWLGRRNHISTFLSRLREDSTKLQLKRWKDVRVIDAGWGRPISLSMRKMLFPERDNGILESLIKGRGIEIFKLNVKSYIKAVKAFEESN